MKSNLFLFLLLIVMAGISSCNQKKSADTRTIPVDVLKDKIAGGWTFALEPACRRGLGFAPPWTPY
ncbi:MAG TPA: hypothetical protein VK205_15235, partial [Prolixibacteraceae bacterium]|nr:hypothetical protein [Prolixibacteraceae bacterium]